MGPVEERIHRAFERERRRRNQLMDAARAKIARHQPDARDWPEQRKRLQDGLFPLFGAFRDAVKQSARPLRSKAFRRHRRTISRFRTGTWPHWRGMAVRLQIVALWLFQVTLVLAALGLFLFVLYQLFVLGFKQFLGP